MALFLLVIGILMFVGLVVIHEFGHYIVAKRNGVEVEEFGIGFPPRAKVFAKKDGTVYTLNWLPLGGFVKLKGEHDSDTEKGTFGAATLKTKVKIMLAGVTMNFLAAFVILTISAFVGVPKLIENQFTIASDTKIVSQEVSVVSVSSGSPAERAGLKQGDQLLSIGVGDDVRQVNTQDELPEITKSFAGKEVVISYISGKQETISKTTLLSVNEVEQSKKTDNPKGYLGISPAEYTLQRSTWSAPIVGAGLVKQFTELTLKGIGSALLNLVKGEGAKAGSQVSGPVGIFVIFQRGSDLGYEFILVLIGLISLTLAIMNTLPIPALDGGRLFVTLLFRAIKKPLKENVEDAIHGTGFAALMLLFVLITIVDIRRFF